MKKCLAIFLSILMLLPLAVPMSALAADEKITPVDGGELPSVLLGGDGRAIVDADGNRVYKFDELLSRAASGEEIGSSEDGLKDSVLDVLKTFIIGVATGNYDEYYEKLQFEVGELTEKLQMDENGDPQYGTDVSKDAYRSNQKNMTTPNTGRQVYGNYGFYYDWRKSPLEIADALDEYIEAVCAMTGKQQVSLTGRCLGTNFVLAYLAKYGYKNRVAGLGLDCGMMYGHDAMSESISGKFKTDGDAINRYLSDMEAYQDANFAPWIKDVIDFAEHAELLHGLSIVTKATIYDQVVEGVSSALALSTMFTIPGYWSCVSLEDYDDAMQYVFGPEGSEKRVKYAGLIEKIEAYHDEVQVNIDSMIKDFTSNGGKLCVFSKYGLQMTPICESRNLVSDDFVSVKNSTMGATTSMLYNTLGDDYIAAREKEDKGKYLSPDRQIDASTAKYPDCTWFLKGTTHSDWTDFEAALIYTVTTADRQLTVDDLTVSRFTVKDKETGAFLPMTADNCHTESWTPEAPKEEQTKVNRVFRFLRSLFGIFKHLFNLLKEKFGN